MDRLRSRTYRRPSPDRPLGPVHPAQAPRDRSRRGLVRRPRAGRRVLQPSAPCRSNVHQPAGGRRRNAPGDLQRVHARGMPPVDLRARRDRLRGGQPMGLGGEVLQAGDVRDRRPDRDHDRLVGPSAPPRAQARVTASEQLPLEPDPGRDFLESLDGEGDELVQRQPEVRLRLGDLLAVHAGGERLLLQLLLDRGDLHALGLLGRTSAPATRRPATASVTLKPAIQQERSTNLQRLLLTNFVDDRLLTTFTLTMPLHEYNNASSRLRAFINQLEKSCGCSNIQFLAVSELPIRENSDVNVTINLATNLELDALMYATLLYEDISD